MTGGNPLARRGPRRGERPAHESCRAERRSPPWEAAPRQAARLKSVRPRLIALLKDFENRSERPRRDGRPADDFGWMWQALGLDRP